MGGHFQHVTDTQPVPTAPYQPQNPPGRRVKMNQKNI